MTLETSISELRGVGPVVARKLKKLGILSVGDLLHYVPTSYEDYRERYLVAKAPVGVSLMLEGTLVDAVSRRSWRNRKLNVTESLFRDSSGGVRVVWFGRFPRKIPTNIPIRLFGVIDDEKNGRQLVNPLWERADTASSMAGKLWPRYPLTEGISQYHLRTFVQEALSRATIKEWHAPSFLRENKLASLADALPAIHFPVSDRGLQSARRRLAFDEVFFVQLARSIARKERAKRRAPPLVAEVTDIENSFPFPLTVDQRRAAEEIAADLRQSHPMARLLQGEVGSGKTVVATLAAAIAARSKYQVIYLAPTEILAQQQYISLSRSLADKTINVALLTSTTALFSNVSIRRQELLSRIDDVDVLVGTHALLETDIKLPRVGLVIVDEQHRFGVGQRLLAEKKGKHLVPHLLSMTATPIPRTLQLAFFGDIDISNLKTMPHGARRVKTMLFTPRDRRRVEVAMKRRIEQGEQIFVVCPLIDPSDKLGVRSATAEYERLRKEGFPAARIGLLHGKLKSDEKVAVLNDFREHRLDVLVATTVIEVGIDVPEATVLVIEGAERFGLAQLHQLRGRVGRGIKEGICVLFPTVLTDLSKERLQAFTETSDGFALSELDLKLRGPGEWFGARQSGFEEFRVADMSDQKLLREAEEAAQRLLEDDPELTYAPGVFYRVTELQLKLHHAS